jgi:hypothetical protein
MNKPNYLSNAPLSWRFNPTGGYDCMYSGYDILDKYGAVLFTLDGKDFGQEAYTGSPIPEAEEVARWVVSLVNSESSNQ